VEEEIFEKYMAMLFDAAELFVIIYSSDKERETEDAPHVRHRKFTKWVIEKRPEWSLYRHIPNRYPFQGDIKRGSFSDFFVYEMKALGEGK